MDVRWKREKVNHGSNGNGFNLVAVLVENHQKETGSGPGIHPAILLGSIGEKFLHSKARDMRSFHQGLFWLNVDKQLNSLGLSSENRDEIELKISETVPRPNEDWPLWSVTCIPRYDP
jgi:hypothetical protein